MGSFTGFATIIGILLWTVFMAWETVNGFVARHRIASAQDRSAVSVEEVFNYELYVVRFLLSTFATLIAFVYWREANADVGLYAMVFYPLLMLLWGISRPGTKKIIFSNNECYLFDGRMRLIKGVKRKNPDAPSPSLEIVDDANQITMIKWPKTLENDSLLERVRKNAIQ